MSNNHQSAAFSEDSAAKIQLNADSDPAPGQVSEQVVTRSEGQDREVAYSEEQTPCFTKPVPEKVELPEFSTEIDSPYRHSDPRFIKVHQLTGWLGFVGILLCGGLVQIVLVAANDSSPWRISYFSIGLFFLHLFVLAILGWNAEVFIFLEHQHATWRLTSAGLEIRRGVWWRHEITVPISRVQHTDVHQGPLLRQFGLATLVIHTAGTQDASVGLEGLSHEDAKKLRDALVAGREVLDG